MHRGGTYHVQKSTRFESCRLFRVFRVSLNFTGTVANSRASLLRLSYGSKFYHGDKYCVIGSAIPLCVLGPLCGFPDPHFPSSLTRKLSFHPLRTLSRASFKDPTAMLSQSSYSCEVSASLAFWFGQGVVCAGTCLMPATVTPSRFGYRLDVFPRIQALKPCFRFQRF
jgi:hypothetical protein